MSVSDEDWMAPLPWVCLRQRLRQPEDPPNWQAAVPRWASRSNRRP